MSIIFGQNEEDALLDEDSVEENILNLMLLNARKKRSFFPVFQIIFFLIGFLLVTNTIILYGFVYGTNTTEEDVLQLLLLLLGMGLLRLSYLFIKYSKCSKEFYIRQDINSFRKAINIDLKIWQIASVVTILFFFSIIVAVFFVGILHLDDAFWIFLDTH